MRARVLDTWSGEKVWTSSSPIESWTEGELACDCLRASFFNPRKQQCCWEGDDCLGNERWVVTEVVLDEDEDEAPTLHECNQAYPEELLFANGIELD